MAQLSPSELLEALAALAGEKSTQDVQTNPVAAAVLADTGALAAGKYLVMAAM